MDKDLKNRLPAELERLVDGFGEKKYLAKYIFKFIHSQGAAEVKDITPLSNGFRRRLAEAGYYISNLKSVEVFVDPDGTIKYLFELADGSRFETVLLVDDGRQTLCVSTQAGCGMNCSFCATGRLELERNLTAAEIADQVNFVAGDRGRVNNVVYMGMGEPLENYDAVLRSVRILNHSDGKKIGVRHLTVSTCGVVPGITRLASENIRPRLAVSLNSADDEVRNKIMPINRKYPLAVLMEAVKKYQAKTGNRVTFEYVLMKNINDTALPAERLINLVRGIRCNVNLIEYNRHPGCELKASSRDSMRKFAGILEKAGIETVIRFKRGQKIRAACGQLGSDLLANDSS